MTQSANESSATTLPRIEIPPDDPPDAAEIERRRELFARVIARRDRIGPIGIPIDQLVREGRDQEEPLD